MKLKIYTRLITFAAISLVALAACQSAAPTATIDEPVAMVVPSVSVSAQELSSENSVVIAKVVSDGPGWLVIHAQADGKPGAILGKSPVASGENTNLIVEIDTTKATETLYAMLHTDAGVVGTFEFPDGPDGPVTVDGQAVTPDFAVAGLVIPKAETIPSVSVIDQEVVDGSVTVASVVSDGPGWLVIHAQADGKPGPILGKSPVASGQNTNLIVDIDDTNDSDTLYAMLHTDVGEVGTFEFPDGPDGPVTVEEKVVTPQFKVLAKMKSSDDDMAAVSERIKVADQAIANGTVTISEAFSEGPGWLVIHAQADGKPGPILGYASLGDGINSNVFVDVDNLNATDTVYAMLHVDTGEVGVFEFPDGTDGPVTVNEQVVIKAFALQSTSTESENASIDIRDSSYGPKELTIPQGTTVVWTQSGSYPHTVTADDNSFDSGKMKQGDSFSFTFSEPGEYPYYCVYHGGPGGSGMSGVIIVTEN